MSTLFDCADSTQLLTGMRQARQAIGRGELVVMPTDTVYGVAADAFTPAAVTRLLEAKGRGRQSPPPVLVSGRTMMQALVSEIPDAVDRLIEAFWPGGLTIVLPAQPSLSWDLGDTFGTVAVRMPDQPFALELLEETGPLAVSSANLTGRPAATTAADAQRMLGDSVTVYLDAGASRTGISSTIVDATGLVGGDGSVHVLRDGAIDRDRLRDVLGDVLADDADDADGTAGGDADGDADTDDAAVGHEHVGEALPDSDASADAPTDADEPADTAPSVDTVPSADTAPSDDTVLSDDTAPSVDADEPAALPLVARPDISGAIEDAPVVLPRPLAAPASDVHDSADRPDAPEAPAVPAADVAATGGGDG